MSILDDLQKDLRGAGIAVVPLSPQPKTGKSTMKKSPNPIDQHVGQRVRVRRVLCGMSQTALANELGLTFQQLQKYESGANRISASRLWAISKILDVPVSWFFEGIDGEPADEISTKRETLELVRNIEACPPAVRKHVRSLIKSMASAGYPAAAE